METFPVFDASAQRLDDATEILSVSWYATAGTMARDRTAADGLASTNTWTAPAAAGPVFLWAVLHDSRGGLDFASLEVGIR